MTPPSRNGSAHAGLLEWLVQRITAIYLALFFPGLVLLLLFHPVSRYEEWRALFTGPWHGVVWLFAILGVLIHAWVGMRSVMLDYLSTFWLRMVATLIVATGVIVCALWAVAILFGGRA